MVFQWFRFHHEKLAQKANIIPSATIAEDYCRCYSIVSQTVIVYNIWFELANRLHYGNAFICCWPQSIPDNKRRLNCVCLLWGICFVLSVRAVSLNWWSLANCLNSYWFNKFQITQLIPNAMDSILQFECHTVHLRGNIILINIQSAIVWMNWYKNTFPLYLIAYCFCN